MPDRRWLSPEAAAHYLDVCVEALRRLVKAGKIPAPDYRLGPRSPRYDREALDKAMGSGLPSRDPDRLLEKYLARQAAVPDKPCRRRNSSESNEK